MRNQQGGRGQAGSRRSKKSGLDPKPVDTTSDLKAQVAATCREGIDFLELVGKPEGAQMSLVDTWKKAVLLCGPSSDVVYIAHHSEAR